MAKFELKFICKEDDTCYIKCEEDNGIIEIILEEDNNYNVIYLDKSTAIKFAKTLRTEINKMEDEK